MQLVSVNGKLIAKSREKMGETQEQCAAATDLGLRTLQRAETLNLATMKTVRVLATHFRMDPVLLLDANAPQLDYSAKEATVLALFSPDLLSHPPSVTRVYRYGNFGSETGWNPKTRQINAVTYGEMDRLWTDMTFCGVYEALQYRFVEQGGLLRRIFLTGDKASPTLPTGETGELLRVLHRHEQLGFAPRVLSCLDYNDCCAMLGVKCTMFVLSKNAEVYYLQFPKGEEPMVIGTSNADYLKRAAQCFDTLWQKSEEYPSWAKRHKLRLSAKDKTMIDKQVEAVRIFAARPETKAS